jgi:diguanylate cyclase (GGDEF)-like protein
MRSLLVLLVLVPTAGLVLLSAGSVRSAWDERRAAHRTEEGVRSLTAAIDARRALTDEELYASIIANAATLGIDERTISSFYGTDVGVALDEARATVDEDPVLAADVQLRTDVADLREHRARIDDEGVDDPEVQALFARLRAHVDEEWAERLAEVTRSGDLVSLSEEAREDVEAVAQAYEVLATSTRRVYPARSVLTGVATPAVVAELFDAESRLDAAVAALEGSIGPRAAAAWQQLEADESAQVFEETVDEALVVAAGGADATLDPTSGEFVERFAGAAPLVEHLTDLVQAAAADLEAQADADARSAVRTAALQAGGTIVLLVVSVASAALIARQVERPARRLGAAAREVRDGRFAQARLATSGPRELAEAASAFNEMSATLQAVEERAVLLAEDPTAVQPTRPLPGRIGDALHDALEQLRASMHASEDQRAELADLASHDGLTGLLNRRAGLDALDRALARSRRHGGCTMVLFVDLDGLKQLNDRYGHEAGDAALVLVADALGAITRADDAVARLGGDEFVVAGSVDGPAEVQALAERIRSQVGSTALAWRGHGLRVRCSIGMAVGVGDETAEELVRQADLALYEAKGQGRDRIAWAPAGAQQ